MTSITSPHKIKGKFSLAAGTALRPVYTGAKSAPVYTARTYGPYIRPVYTGSVYRLSEGQYALLYQISSKSSFFVAAILQFFKFSKWPPPPSWIFDNSKFYWLLGWWGSTGEGQRANFRQNRSIGCEDVKIFRFYKKAAAAILDFQICEILLVDGVWRPQAHNCTKFRLNQSSLCGDIAIFPLFKMATAAILDFWNREILLVQTHLHAKFCQNRSIDCEDIIFRFFKMAAVRHIGFVSGIFRPPTVNTCGSLSLCKIWLWSMQ